MAPPILLVRRAGAEEPRRPLLAPALILAAGAALGFRWTAGLAGTGAGGPPAGGELRRLAWTIPAAGGAAARPPMTELLRDGAEFDELLELFRGGETAPQALGFVEAFRAQPKLNAMWNEFVDQEGEPGQTLEGFARELSARPEFRQLLSRFAQEPGFRQAAFVLAQAPRLERLLRGPLLRARSGRGSRPGASGSGRPARQAGGPVQGASRASRGSERRTGGPAGPLMAAAGPALPASGQIGSPRQAPAAASQEAHAATPLAQVPGAGGASPLSAWASLCRRRDPRLSQRLCDVMTSLAGNPYSAWGACVAGKVYDQCALACRDIPELQCRAPEWLDACLEAYGPEECRRRCLESGRSACGAPEYDPGGAAFRILGYDRLDGMLTVNRAERELLEGLYRSYVAGTDPASIARRLNALGLRHKLTGEPFTGVSVLTVMKRRVYKGIPGVAETVVSSELWERARARMLREGAVR